jgi:two-component sensor histidine kinase/DNA-binding response OmpR family regulator
MASKDKVNILLVDDQPGKLLSYEVILSDLNENLLKAASANEALQHLLKNDVAVVLVDVCMPELDGFELAAMIRDHPRFQRTAIIFISAIHLTDTDHLHGYEMGAVDYVPVPVVPEVLRAKVRVFAELYRKTRELEKLNAELEQRVAERTSELEASNALLRESESRRSLALAAGQMGGWDWELESGECVWDAGQYRIFGVDPDRFEPTFDNIQPFIHPEDLERIKSLVSEAPDKRTFQIEARIIRPNDEIRWCICAAAMTLNDQEQVTRVSGVTIDITERKEAEERQLLLAREVDHRARNVLAVVQAIVRLTRAGTPEAYVTAVEGRIRALAQAHTLLSRSRWQGADVVRLIGEELAPYSSGTGPKVQMSGPSVFLAPDRAQILALAVHELATNSAKYGALSSGGGALTVTWEVEERALTLRWHEKGGPPVEPPTKLGFGTKIMGAMIKQQIGGEVVMDWRPDGLHCALTIPSGTPEAKGTAAAKAGACDLLSLPTSNRKRILLAEDEALVGMMMRDLVTDLGLFVIGPFCSVEETMAAVSSHQFDCAILDINLAGQTIYPVAERLAARDLPFVFITGYGPESVDERFAHVPILQKPVARGALDEVLRRRLSGEPGAQAPRRAPADESQERGASIRGART